jgi:hypothetical protein
MRLIKTRYGNPKPKKAISQNNCGEIYLATDEIKRAITKR